MKKIILFTFAILLSSLAVLGQSFEGKITYSNTYKSNNPQITSQQWELMMGSVQQHLRQI